jgi:hypothetical protein
VQKSVFLEFGRLIDSGGTATYSEFGLRVNSLYQHILSIRLAILKQTEEEAPDVTRDANL